MIMRTEAPSLDFGFERRRRVVRARLERCGHGFCVIWMWRNNSPGEYTAREKSTVAVYGTLTKAIIHSRLSGDDNDLTSDSVGWILRDQVSQSLMDGFGIRLAHHGMKSVRSDFKMSL